MKFILLSLGLLVAVSSSAFAAKNIAGYDFDGFEIRKALPQGKACPTVVSIERRTCYDIDGIVSVDENCNDLCSIPIAEKGKIAGYDFNGFEVRNEKAKDTACPAILKEEAQACTKVKGITSVDESCEVLCSQPIAAKGKVVGFDFDGFHIRNELPQGSACPEILKEEAAACIKIKGNVSVDEKCETLCSLPILH